MQEKDNLTVTSCSSKGAANFQALLWCVLHAAFVLPASPQGLQGGTPGTTHLAGRAPGRAQSWLPREHCRQRLGGHASQALETTLLSAVTRSWHRMAGRGKSQGDKAQHAGPQGPATAKLM